MAIERLSLTPGRDGWFWRYRKGAGVRRMHRHVEPEVNLVLAGQASYLVGERRIDLRPGTSLWLFPAQEHVLLNESADFTMWIGVFRPTMLERVCTDAHTRPLLEPDPDVSISKQLTAPAMEQINAMIEQLTAHEHEAAWYNAGLAYVALTAWGLHRQAGGLVPGADVHRAVERAARLIRDNPAPAGIEQVAEAVGLSASRLSRLFKQQTGVSLTQYRQRQQLRRFFALYGAGRRRNLMQAALEAGFGSYPQFHRVFKAHVGYSPAEYRRRMKDDNSQEPARWSEF